MAGEWRDNLRMLVEKPKLRPFFEEGQNLSPDDPDRQTVLAIADVRLDTMDATLTYASGRFNQDTIAGWRNTFASAFRTSPTLCSRLMETQSNLGLIVPIGQANCQMPPSPR